MGDLTSIIKAIQDIMRKDVGVDGDAQRIGQMVWMFFLKILDDREQELELIDDDFVSALPDHLRWRNWAGKREGLTGEGLFDFVQDTLFPKLKSPVQVQGPQREQALIIQRVFENAYNYMKSGTLLRQVINKINEIDFNNRDDWHTFGGIYEQILRDLQSAGNAGEFYTPRAVTRFIVNRVDPKLDEVVFDPACGTGGFLTCAIDHKKEHYAKSSKERQQLAKTIRGVEKKPLPYMLCMTNMILHGIDTPSSIRLDNTLAKPYRDYGDKDRVQCIITNPPFGGIEEDGIEQYFPSGLRTRETADLFIAVIIKLLKKHGRAAVVLPDGFLFGEGTKTRLKESLLTECNLHTIVRLPNGVFNPYTSIKTNILFFTKGQPTADVWFYEHPYPEGVKNYNKSKPMQFSEFQPEIDWWGDEADGFKARKETKQAWKRSVEYFEQRGFNFDDKNPFEEARNDLNPDDLLHEYRAAHGDIQKLRDQLKTILSDALNGSLTNSQSPEELAQNWARIKAHFDTLFTTEESIKALRQTSTQLGAMGLLTTPVREFTNPETILDRIAREKNKLVSQGIIRREKPLTAPVASDFPFPIPDGWIWAKVGDVALFTQYGTSQKASRRSGGISVLAMGNIQNGTVTLESEKALPRDWEEFPALLLEPGDLLYNRTNSAELVGKTGLFDGPENEFTFASYLIRIRLIERWVRPKYLNFVMNSPYFRKTQVVPHIKKQTGQANVNGTILKNMLVPLPPTEEQDAIVDRVQTLHGICSRLEMHLNRVGVLQSNLADTLISKIY